MSNQWLESVARGTLHVYTEHILKIRELTQQSTKQLVVDIGESTILQGSKWAGTHGNAVPAPAISSIWRCQASKERFLFIYLLHGLYRTLSHSQSEESQVRGGHKSVSEKPAVKFSF